MDLLIKKEVPTTKYEYCVEHLGGYIEYFEKELNEFGEQGWKVIHIDFSSSSGYTCVFMREKKEQ